ncbi:TonB-dependent siderophore receptor [Herbaspirillum lusitanum]|uniref:TonB-dependent siderophore receptor n=1 Tax=Herbaspirillum lusitanum TaxID=213312 RepID=A0ABW9A6J5_9BURK
MPFPDAVAAPGERPLFRQKVLVSVLLAALSAGAAWSDRVYAAGSLDAAAKTYNIPAGPLGKTLSTFALDAGIALSFEPALTEGLNSPGVSGTLAPKDALARLLAGSGLEIVVRNDGTYTLRKQIAGADNRVADGALPAVTVVGAAEASAVTEGSGSYTTRATGAATRMNLSLRETPQSVSVISRQQIQDQNLMTLVDVLRQTPGIVADRLDERVTFSSRGFALNTMIDGVPTLAFNSVAGESSMINTAFYDRVEVVRGAAGLLNGSGSPGGSINLVRKRPTSEFSGHVTAGIGSWNRYITEADLGGSLNAAGTVRGRVVASHADGNSFIDNKKQSDDVFYGIVEADLSRDTLLTAGYEYERTAIKGANFGQSPLFYANGTATNLPRSFNSSAPWSTWNMTTERAFVNLDQRFDSGWHLKVDAAYARNKRERYSADLWLYPANISASANTGTVQVANNPADSTNKSLDVYATGPFSLFGRIHEAVAGFNINQYHYDYSNDGAVLNAFDRRAVNIFNLGAVAQPNFSNPLNKFGGDAEEKALYGAARFKPLDTLSLLVGGRFSWYDNKSYQRVWTNGTNGALVNVKPVTESAVFTPYAGIVYDVSKDFSLYASYTDIFQPNTVRDSSSQIISPKRGTNTELGIKGEHLDGRLNTSFAVFQTEEDNATEIDSGAPLLSDGTTPYRAVKGARTKGFEATISGEVASGLQLMAGYTYSSKFSNKNVLMNPTYPQRMFRLAGSYRFPGALSKLTIGGTLNYQSSIYYDETYSLKRATQGGLTLIGLMARYDFSKQFSMSLNIENLSDKYYYTGLGGYNGYTYGNPRNAWLKATYNF